MTEDMIPMMMLIAFAGGCMAGFGMSRSKSTCIRIFFTTIFLNMVGWVVYGYNLRGFACYKTFGQEIAGSLIVLPGLLLFNFVPAAVGSFITITVIKLFKKQKTKSEE